MEMSATNESATLPIIVHLTPMDKARLDELAANERVTVDELLRGCVNTYEDSMTRLAEEQELEPALAEMSKALDVIIESIRSNRTDISENVRQMQARKHV